jgi:uroporphyrinogen decarboxylase
LVFVVQGGGSKTWSKAKTWLYRYPQESHVLLQCITDVVVDYLVAKVEAGAQALQVFDSWAGELAPHTFFTFAFPYLQQISRRLREVGEWRTAL